MFRSASSDPLRVRGCAIPDTEARSSTLIERDSPVERTQSSEQVSRTLRGSRFELRVEVLSFESGVVAVEFLPQTTTFAAEATRVEPVVRAFLDG